MKTLLLLLTLAISGAAQEVTSERLVNSAKEPGNWMTYSGNYFAHQYSALDQINASNVARLHVKWIYPLKTTHKVETVPLVVDGVMYLTSPPNDIVALDAETGR